MPKYRRNIVFDLNLRQVELNWYEECFQRDVVQHTELQLEATNVYIGMRSSVLAQVCYTAIHPYYMVHMDKMFTTQSFLYSLFVHSVRETRRGSKREGERERKSSACHVQSELLLAERYTR